MHIKDLKLCITSYMLCHYVVDLILFKKLIYVLCVHTKIVQEILDPT